MSSNKIKEYRKKKKMTEKQLANLVGISTGYLCHLERGTRNNPSTEIMKKIANELGESVLDIFFSE